MADTARVVAMAFGAVLAKEFLTGEQAIRLAFVRILPRARFRGRLRDGAQYGSPAGVRVGPGAKGGQDERKSKKTQYQKMLQWNNFLSRRPKASSS